MALRISQGATSTEVFGILIGLDPLVTNLNDNTLRKATPKIRIRFTKIPGGSFNSWALILSARVEKNCDTAIRNSACSFLFTFDSFLSLGVHTNPNPFPTQHPAGKGSNRHWNQPPFYEF